MDNVSSELLKISKLLTGGTWDLPTKSSDVTKILDYIKNMKSGDWPNKDRGVSEDFYDLIGDDSLFDDFYRYEKVYLKSCAKAVIKKIKEFARESEEYFKNKKSHDLLKEIAEKL